MRRLLRLSALVCLVSVSLNTPRTFELYPILQYVTFSCDVATTFLFTAEMAVKINRRGLLKVIKFSLVELLITNYLIY